MPALVPREALAPRPAGPTHVVRPCVQGLACVNRRVGEVGGRAARHPRSHQLCVRRQDRAPRGLLLS